MHKECLTPGCQVRIARLKRRIQTRSADAGHFQPRRDQQAPPIGRAFYCRILSSRNCQQAGAQAQRGVLHQNVDTLTCT